MNIYLLGGSGFIGGNLVKYLTEADHKVWYHNRTDSFKWGSIQHCDVVINCAGETRDEDSMIDSNVVLASELANACRVFNKRLIHLGSISERIGTDFYSATKRASSELILSMARSGCDFCVISPATVFGPGDKSDSLMSIIWDWIEFNNGFALRNSGRDWVYIDDLSRAIVKVLHADKTVGTVFEVGYGVPTMNSQVIALFGQAVGRELEPSISENSPFSSCADIIALNELGWRPKISLQAGIKLFVDWKMTHNRIWTGAEAS